MTPSTFRHRLMLGAAFGIGLSVCAIAAGFVHRWEVSQRHSQFQQQIENLTIALQRSLNRYTDVLTFLDDYYGVAQGTVAHSEFDQFVARSLATYPGIQALEWAPFVTLRDRPAYEQRLSAQRNTPLQITELSPQNQLVPAGQRPDYIPVTYIAPLASNEAALGYDLSSDPARAAALASARDTGEIHVTSRIRLVQEQRNQYGFLVFLPLYQHTPPPQTILARRAQFRGVLVGVFRVSDVVEETLRDLSYDINVLLTDLNAPETEQFLGQYQAQWQRVTAREGAIAADHLNRSRALCSHPTSCIRTVEIGQRQWQIQFSPANAYPLGAPYGTGATLVIGMLLTSGLMLFLHNLQTELARTQALNASKRQFFATVSHELRTPLSTILLSTESLQFNYDNLSEAQKQTALRRIHTTAQHMGQHITDLLTLARAEAGKPEFHPELIDASTYCQTLIDEIKTGIHQRIIFHHGGVIRAFWDKKLLRSLLSNLLSNAAKYSPTDSSISVTLFADHNHATLTVQDQGIGIPNTEHDQVTRAFQRGSNVGQITGTGLGLAIAKTSIDLHRGTLTIHSKKGQGTTVMVTLPLE